MRVVTVGLALVGTVFASQALAADKKAADDKDRMVCKSEKMINSRFEKRVCKTSSEWERLAQVHNEAWRERMSKPVINPAEVP